MKKAPFVRARLLLLIRQHPGIHGYEALARLQRMGVAIGDAATMYRTLRAMEREGLLASLPAPSVGGPKRRIYTITRDGEAALDEAARAIITRAEALMKFAQDYRSSVGPARPKRVPGDAGQGGEA